MKSISRLNDYAGVYDAGQLSFKDGYLIFRRSFQKVYRRLIPASADTFYVEGDLSTKLSSVRSQMAGLWISSF